MVRRSAVLERECQPALDGVAPPPEESNQVPEDLAVLRMSRSAGSQ